MVLKGLTQDKTWDNYSNNQLLLGIAKKIVPQLLMGTAFLKVYLFLKMSREPVEESVVIAPGSTQNPSST
jgi:hypothetical protein